MRSFKWKPVPNRGLDDTDRRIWMFRGLGGRGDVGGEGGQPVHRAKTVCGRGPSSLVQPCNGRLPRPSLDSGLFWRLPVKGFRFHIVKKAGRAPPSVIHALEEAVSLSI